ncbi:MAG: YkgJ family cysteine cluster protein [Anaerolineae bacterium]|nr:YkgJ family cysteine cluster protein [Anaerolineae bacterium]MDQ7035416.1 YkgJ family cysteine cluster protein [Anaerolineae bacterium]
MTLIIDLETVAHLAEQRKDEFDVLRYQLQYDDDLSDEKIDVLVDSIAAPIVAAIDCTQCANCCRGLSVQLGDDDIVNLATATEKSVESIKTDFVDAETYSDDPDIIGTFKHKPCTFLSGKRCSVYAQRPEACRLYPQFTPDFRWMLNWMLEGAGKCPIIYNVLDAVSAQVDDWQRSHS